MSNCSTVLQERESTGNKRRIETNRFVWPSSWSGSSDWSGGWRWRTRHSSCKQTTKKLGQTNDVTWVTMERGRTCCRGRTLSTCCWTSLNIWRSRASAARASTSKTRTTCERGGSRCELCWRHSRLGVQGRRTWRRCWRCRAGSWWRSRCPWYKNRTINFSNETLNRANGGEETDLMVSRNVCRLLISFGMRLRIRFRFVARSLSATKSASWRGTSSSVGNKMFAFKLRSNLAQLWMRAPLLLLVASSLSRASDMSTDPVKSALRRIPLTRSYAKPGWWSSTWRKQLYVTDTGTRKRYLCNDSWK